MPGAATKSARKIGAAAFAAAFLCLSLVSTSRAADSVYWVNYGANKISHANLDGGGGVDIPIPATGTMDGPWGLAIDSAAGKIYWANENNDTIGYANLDGSGSALLSTAGATVDNPIGLAIDPIAGRVYWTSYQGDKISYANLNGSGGGGDLDTTGASINGPEGIAIDSINGPEGIAIDSVAGRIYWSNYEINTIGYASLNGGGGGQLDTGGVIVDKPIGLAIDPLASFIYWANTGNNTIAYTSLNGDSKGQMETTGATLDATAFPVLLKAPRNTEFATVQGQHRPGATLTCTQGKWRGDLLESFLYFTPQSFSCQWFRNGKAIVGATGSTIVANKVGTYACSITATNFAGSNSTVSAIDFSVNATVGFKKVTYNRAKGTATLRVAVTGSGRLDLYGKGVANAQRKQATGTAKITVRTSGTARIKLMNTGKAKVKARIAYTPEGGTAIKRFKTIMLKKRRG